MNKTRVSNEFIEKIFDEIDIELIEAIDRDYVHKQNENYVLISNIYEVPKDYLNNELNVFGNAFYTIARTKLDCTFCFDHELDHVPFMMSIEFFRQFATALSHSHYNVPLVGFTNIMDEIQFRTYNFIELDLPILIICEDEIIKDRKCAQERIVHFYLYQNSELCAKLDSNIMVIKKDVYLRLRQNSRLSIIKNTDLAPIPVTNIQLRNKISSNIY